MSESDRGQVNKSAAQIYQDFFVPALFQDWTKHVLDAAHVSTGQTVLDVACGTGVLTRDAYKRVGKSGQVIGLDINEGMLNVAKQSNTEIDWRQGNAENLPFDDNHFDAVVSQFALMFFENRGTAINEMLRVLKPDKNLAIAVWGSLDNTPGYAQMVNLLARLFGDNIADGLRAPYNLGDMTLLQKEFEEVKAKDIQIKTLAGTARFPSIESWVFTDIKGWTLADSIDDTQYQLLLTEAEKEFQSFVVADGTVTFDAPAHIITIIK